MNTKSIRNLVIFYIGALALSIAGGFVMASGQEAGGLLFITSPLLMVLVVRIFLREGWRDAGLRLNLKAHWRWYLLALVLYPVVFPLVIGINRLFGFTSLTMPLADMVPIILAGVAVQFIPRMIYSITEEWAWRGYMEPRLEALGLSDLPRHLLVGVLWGAWHFPLILSTDYTTVPMLIFAPMFLLATCLLAVFLGQLRKITGSVWPVVLMHGVANTLGYAILDADLIAYNNEFLGSLVPGSVVITLVYAVLAAWILLRKKTAATGTAQFSTSPSEA